MHSTWCATAARRPSCTRLPAAGRHGGPGWLTITLTLAGIAATAERALNLRNHWLIDADTWWLA